MLLNLRNHIRKGIFFLLLFLTFLCLFYPIIMQKKLAAENQVLVTKYKRTSRKTDPSLIDFQKDYNEYLLKAENIRKQEKLGSSMFSSNNGVIGLLGFPSLNLPETPIYYEAGHSSLFHYMYGSVPTVGKSGHFLIQINDQLRNQVDRVRLAQLKTGDCFYLFMSGKKLSYQITEVKKTAHLKKISIQPNQQQLTFVMNNLSGFTDSKTIIVSKQIAKIPNQKSSFIPCSVFSYQTFALLLIVSNGVFFGVLLFSYQRFVQKAHADSFRIKKGGFRRLRGLLQISKAYFILLSLCMSYYLLMTIYRLFFFHY